MKYLIITYGCQFNESDAERAAAILQQMGYVQTSILTEADLVLVLACSVRQMSIDRLYGLKKKFERIRQSRPLVAVLSGCVLNSDREKMERFFDFIIPNTDLTKLPKLLNLKSYSLKASSYYQIHPSYNSKFQAYVPIMSGCNNFCSYCVVPYTRGREASRPAKEIIEECRRLIGNGYKEIVLIGQNVNSYKSQISNYKSQTNSKSKIQNPKFAGQKSKVIYFPQLLKIIDNIPGDFWLSFATSHPKDMSDGLIKVMANGQHIIPYLHLPAQAGDDEILRRMNRHYTAKHYLSLLRQARKAIPDLTVSTDVIVGFPGETKKQFANTVKLFHTAKYDMAYIAQYSPRAGTVAAKMTDDVSFVEKKQRVKILTAILKKYALVRNLKMVGEHVEVLVESSKDGSCFGRTRNFKNIKFTSATDLAGQIVVVKITGAYAWGLSGRLPKVVVIAGTTSAGKTKLAVALAKKIKGEIVSADSRQVYEGMDVGTGKDLKEYGRVPYHLIDISNPVKQVTVAEWQQQALVAINDILLRGQVPIVCGGTGLYISALVEGYALPESKISNLKSQILRKKLNTLSLNRLLSELKKVDAETYNIVDKNNRRRVQRALEIFYETGLPKSQRPENQKPPYDFLTLGITFPKELLGQRIRARLIQRLTKEGMVKEIAGLHRQGVSWKKLEEFGLEYRYVSRYLQKKISYDEMVTQLANAIIDFAKRQMTWFRRDKNIVWLSNKTKIFNRVAKFLK